MRRMLRALARLDDHWLGDVVGSLCLFALIPIGLFAALVFGGVQ